MVRKKSTSSEEIPPDVILRAINKVNIIPICQAADDFSIKYHMLGKLVLDFYYVHHIREAEINGNVNVPPRGYVTMDM